MSIRFTEEELLAGLALLGGHDLRFEWIYGSVCIYLVFTLFVLYFFNVR